MRRMGLDTKQLTPRTVLGRISWAKNHMIDPQEYYLDSKDPNSERIAHIYQSYKAELKKNNALDFDDLLLEAVRLLKVSAETRERYQRRYRYLLVDEYQDTNRPQYELMKLARRRSRRTSALSAMKTRASTRGAAPTFATSWSLRRTFLTRRSFAWSRTTAQRRSFSKPPAPLSPTTFAARAKSSGPIARAGR